jgi:hypothetical protein
MSGKNREEGVVIPRGQSEIIVREFSNALDIRVRKFMEEKYRVSVMSERRLPAPHGVELACGELHEIRSTFEIAPGAVQEVIFYVCRTKLRYFMTIYTHWLSDGNDLNCETVAVAVARSLTLAN